MYDAHITLYSTLTKLNSGHIKLNSAQSKLYSAPRTVYAAHVTPFAIFWNCTLFDTFCTLHAILCTQNTVHHIPHVAKFILQTYCKLHTAHCTEVCRAGGRPRWVKIGSYDRGGEEVLASQLSASLATSPTFFNVARATVIPNNKEVSWQALRHRPATWDACAEIFADRGSRPHYGFGPSLTYFLIRGSRPQNSISTVSAFFRPVLSLLSPDFCFTRSLLSGNCTGGHSCCCCTTARIPPLCNYWFNSANLKQISALQIRSCLSPDTSLNN